MESALATKSSVLPGKMLGVGKNGLKILVANLGGAFYTIGDICTHMGCNLSDGTLRGGQVQCPCHGSTFDIRTGVVIHGPAQKPEPSYALKIIGEQIVMSL